MRTARVVISKATHSYDKEYDYILPENIKAYPGCRVLVPFGAGGRRVGLITDIFDGQEQSAPRMKQVYSLLDEKPLLNDEGLYLLSAVKNSCFCTWFEALGVLIPPGAGVKLNVGLSAVKGIEFDEDSLSPEAAQLYAYLSRRKGMAALDKLCADLGFCADAPCIDELLSKGLATRGQIVKKKVADERAVMVRLVSEDLEGVKLTEKQQAAAELLLQLGCVSLKEICYFTGVGRSVLDALRKRGVVEFFEEIVARKTADKAAAVTDTAPIILSQEQQKVFDDLSAIGQKNEYAVSLLHGVTGSGKTQVFLRLIEEALSRGKNAMVLIPEISLTPQTVARFCSRFGSQVAVLHSSLSMTERLDEWQRIREGRARIVVGTRSAVFAPMENIGLIVIDEEQEHTYHSESAPRYHARDIAKIRAHRHGAQLLLCSATPAVESYYNAKNGKYNLAKLTTRYSGNMLPDVMTIDMRSAPLSAFSRTLSQELCEQIRENLERKEQSILLLNRRGYNTLVKCSECGETAKCPHCSISLIYHTANHRMVCHYCGYSRAEKDPCPTCGSAMLRYTGSGTQRIEEELREIFPEARILRMDMDTTMSRFAHQRSFEAFARGEYDIMVGTQMVAKGLDFPNVTLVGVLNADQTLYSDDFRSYERTFSLITQVVGRCGRAEKPGRAVIQTFSPDDRILALASSQDYDAFYAEEIQYRRMGLYPPFCDIVCAAFWDENEKTAVQSAKAYSETFIQTAKKSYPDLPIRLLGPSECRPYKVAGRYRCRLLIKCRSDKKTRALFAEMQQWYHKQKDAALITLDFYYNSNM